MQSGETICRIGRPIAPVRRNASSAAPSQLAKLRPARRIAIRCDALIGKGSHLGTPPRQARLRRPAVRRVPTGEPHLLPSWTAFYRDNASPTRNAQPWGSRSISWPQKRRTVQPAAVKRCVCSRSRVTFRSSLASQYPVLLAGRLQHCGHPCQKQPSTKTATRLAANTKSGLVRSTRAERRQPRVPDAQRLDAKRCSSEVLSLGIAAIVRLR